MNRPKIFNTQRLTKKELRSLICKTAEQLGVTKTSFNTNGKKVRGTYNTITGILYIDASQTKKDTLLTFFHELGHHFAVKRSKWKKYHHNLVKHMSAESVFEVENKVDGLSNALWNKYVNLKQWGNYKYMYPKSKKQVIMKQIISNEIT